MGQITDAAISKAEKIVMDDLASKKLGNNSKSAIEPSGPISQAVKDATLTLDVKTGTVK